jgi:sugar phosphate isomerase/epimerase
MPKTSLNPVTISQCNFEQSLQVAQRVGFDGIGLRFNLIRDYLNTGRSISDAKRIIEECDLVATEMGFLTGWMFHDGIPLAGKRNRTGETKEQLVEEMHFFFSITRELGSPPVTALTPADEVGLLEEAARDFSWLCDQAAKYDLRVMLEFFGSAPQVNRIKDAWDLIEASKRDNCGLLLDSFLLFMGEFNLDDLNIVPADRIFAVHISDAKPKPRGELDMLKDRLLPGHGVIPLREFVNAIRGTGYDGYFTVEIFNEEYAREDPVKIAQQSRELLEGILAT